MSDPMVDGVKVGSGETLVAPPPPPPEKIQEPGDHGDSDDSFSSADNKGNKQTHPEKYHLFGRQKPVYSALGGGRSADVFLWRNKQISGCLLAAATVIWLLFEWIGYHLLSFVCHSLILSLATLFLWSNLSFFVKKSPVQFPKVELPEEVCLSIALLLRNQFNIAVNMFREVASGKDLKKFLYAILTLWLVSVVGSWFEFLTLLYIIFVMMLTIPLLYERHEEQVDAYAEKATKKLKKQYSKLDENVLQKLPKVPFGKDNNKQQ